MRISKLVMLAWMILAAAAPRIVAQDLQYRETQNGVQIGTPAATLSFFSNLGPTSTFSGQVQESSTNDLLQSLVAYGLISGSAATPLNLNGGTISAGTLTLAGDPITTSTNTVVLSGTSAGSLVITIGTNAYHIPYK